MKRPRFNRYNDGNEYCTITITRRFTRAEYEELEFRARTHRYLSVKDFLSSCLSEGLEDDNIRRINEEGEAID